MHNGSNHELTPTTPKQVPFETYRQHLLRAKARGSYFDVFRPYILVMSRLEIMFVQDIVNHAATREETHPRVKNKRARMRLPPLVLEEDGLFYVLCSEKFLYNSMLWTRKEQEKNFKSLKAKGYVKIKLVGMPRRRYVYVDVWRIETDVDTAKAARFQSPPKGGDCTPPKGGNNNTLPYGKGCNKALTNRLAAHAAKPEGDTDLFHMPELPAPEPKGKPLGPKDLQWATALRDALKARGINVTPIDAPPVSWAKQFRRLRRKLEELDPDRAEGRIEEVLNWYIPRIGKKGIHHALCGESFQEKFAKMEERMKLDRELNPAVVPSPAAIKLADRHRWSWPGDMGKDVPAYTELVLSAYAAWRKKVHRFRTGIGSADDKVRRLVRFAEVALDGLKGEDAFAVDLLRKEFQLARKYGPFPLLPRAAKWTEVLEKEGSAVAAKWGDSSLWSKLQKEVGNG